MERDADDRLHTGAFLGLITEGQEGFWPTTPRVRLERAPCWFDTPDELVQQLVGDGWGDEDYFVPYPFQERKRRFVSVANEVNVVRADIDPPKDWDYEAQQGFCMERLEDLRTMVGEPSAILHSGRGRWVYYKLSGLISKDEARLMNQVLHALAGSDDLRAYNPSWWARLPGSINEKTGVVARVVELGRGRVYDPDVLRPLVREIAPVEKGKVRSRRREDFRWKADDLLKVVCPPDPVFSAEVLEYIECCPTTEGSIERFGKTRHEMEQKIFGNLAGHGWTTEEIHAFSYQRGLSRYIEEFERGSTYADYSIAMARKWVDEHPFQEPGGRPPTPNTEYIRELSPPSEEPPRKVGVQHRLGDLPLRVLREIDGSRPGETYTRIASDLRGKPGVSERNLQRIVADLDHRGFLIREVDDLGGRLLRTPKGDKAVAARFRPAVLMANRLTPKGHEGRRKAIEAQKEAARSHRPVGRGGSPGARQRKIAQHKYRSDYDGRLRLHFDGQKRVFHLQLVSPISQVATVLLHRQLHLGFDADGWPIYANAISPLEPALGGQLGDDPIIEHGRRLWQCSIGTAAFLEVGDEGMGVATSVDGNGEAVPATGLLIEDTRHFWNALLQAVPNPDGRLLRVTRSGPWNRRRFSFEDVGDAIPLDPSLAPDLITYLDEISSTERLHRMVADQPDYATLRLHL